LLLELFLPLPDEFCPQWVGWNVADECTKDFQPVHCSLAKNTHIISTGYDRPFSFLLVGISEEHDFFIIWEYQTERSLDATQAIIVVCISTASRRTEWVRLIIFDRYGLFEPDRGGGFLRDIIESN
jgi:hypothetical protein